MATAKYESDNNTGTELLITMLENGDVICAINGDGEVRISANNGKLTGVRLRIIQSHFATLISELNKGVVTLNKEQFADMLNGRIRGHELTKEEQEIAKENGLVVVYGHSDDGMVFNGAIFGQVDCWQGGIAYLDESGIKKAITDSNRNKMIRAVCSDERARIFDGKAYWSYETDIPHVRFLVYEYEIDANETRGEDEDAWCEGIIFDITALSS